MIQQNVIIPSKDGYPLAGVLRIPDEEGKYPVVIVCHGFLANKDRELIFDIANGLSYARMATLRFDFSSQGDSGGQPGRVTLTQEAKDIRACIDFLEGVPQVDKERIAVVGHGLGAMAAVAAQDPRVTAYVLIAMRDRAEGFVASYFSEPELREWEATGMYDCQEVHGLHVGFLQDLRKHDILGLLERLVRPSLIIQGTDDKRTPAESAKALAYHAKFPTLELIEGADHGFSDRKQCQGIIDAMAGWLARVLR